MLMMLGRHLHLLGLVWIGIVVAMHEGGILDRASPHFPLRRLHVGPGCNGSDALLSGHLSRLFRCQRCFALFHGSTHVAVLPPVCEGEFC